MTTSSEQVNNNAAGTWSANGSTITFDDGSSPFDRDFCAEAGQLELHDADEERILTFTPQ